MPSYSRILISGGSGFLGWNLARYAAKDYDVFLTYRKHRINVDGCEPPYYLDLRNDQAVEKLIEDLHPEVIIHTAALANADVCEQHRPVAHEINANGTRRLVKKAEEVGARFMYISTDMVFDGNSANNQEQDRPKPVNYYGETKLLGEKVVREISSNYLILRMALMYGYGNEVNGCFSDWLYEGLQGRKRLSLFTDQYRTPLYVQDGARALFELLHHPVKNEVFHLGGSERLTRYEFGKSFCRIWGFDEQHLHPVLMKTIETVADRGYDCSLNTDKVQKFLSFQLSDVESGLQQMKDSDSQVPG